MSWLLQTVLTVNIGVHISFWIRVSSRYWYMTRSGTTVQWPSSVQLFVTPWTAACQALLSLPELGQIHVPWISAAILCHPLLLLPSVFPSIRFFFQWVSCSHHVVKVLEFQFQHQPFQGVLEVDFLYTWLARSPCSPGDSKESFPAPQFEIINSFGALHSLWFSSHIIHDYWKDHILEYMDLCQQSDVFAF